MSMSSAPQLPGLTELTEVGRGAYGVVYRARQDQLHRFVAVKVLNTKLGEEAARRFTQEGQSLGALSGHPHIITVHEAGTTQSGEPYLVMPFCERGSLAKHSAGGATLGWQEMLDLGVRLAGALQTAHDAGILHRDIKPGNILVDGYGSPRLADFGQARHADSELTATGFGVVGTPAYTAPEVLRGDQAGAASDVHSLAATLVSLVTGHGPYSTRTGENVATVMYRVLNEPPLDLRPAGVPDQVCEVLEWALHKDPWQRPPSAAVFGKAMQGLRNRFGLPPTPLTVPGETSTPVPAATPAGPPPPSGHTGPPRPAGPGTPTGPPTGPVSGHGQQGVPSTPTGQSGPTPPWSGPPPAPHPPSASPGPWPPLPNQRFSEEPTGPTGPTGAHGSAGSPRPARRRVPWLVGAAVVVIAALVTSLWLVTDDDQEPDQPPAADPNDLLLSRGDYGAGELEVAQRMSGLFTILFGDQGEMRVTNLADCLALPVDQVLGWATSPLYYNGTPAPMWTEQPEDFVSTESAGIAMRDTDAATRMVERMAGAKFDGCKGPLLEVAPGLVNADKTSADLDIGLADLPQPEPVPDDGYQFGGKRISVPLLSKKTSKGIGDLHIDVLVMSHDASVLMAVIQAFPREQSQTMLNTTTESMIAKLNAATPH